MAGPAERWLLAQGFLVRDEVPMPWGVCDLVGMRVSKRRAQLRLRLGQRKRIYSLPRIELLARVPDVDTGTAISLRTLGREFGWLWSPTQVERELNDLVSQGFLIRRGRTLLQRVNGWAPLHRSLVAVELKLGRVDEAFHQAKTHLAFTPLTYVGFPSSTALRVARGDWGVRFREAGVGVLAIDRDACRALIRPRKSSPFVSKSMAMYVGEKFWTDWLRDNTSSTAPRPPRASLQCLQQKEAVGSSACSSQGRKQQKAPERVPSSGPRAGARRDR